MGCVSSSKARPPIQGQPVEPNAQRGQTAGEIEEDLFEAGILNQDEDLERELMAEHESLKGRKGGRVLHNDESPVRMIGVFELEEAGEGDQMLAIKPWMGALKEPINPPPIKKQAPDIHLDLEYCYGYRTFDARQNLFYTSDPNKVVYMTAAIGVVLDTVSNTQKFFGAGDVKTTGGHTDDITALAVHPDKDTVATGEVGKNPKICIWKASDPSHSINQFNQGRDSRAVTALGFNSDGSLLASADLHNKHHVRVWTWANGQLFAQVESGPDKILDLCWALGQNKFCTVGVKHIMFWTHGASTLTKKSGILGTGKARPTLTCVQWIDSNTSVAGSATGHLLLFKDTNLMKMHAVHGRGQGVHSLRILDGQILSGSRDHTVKVLDMNFKEIRQIDVGSIPRALDIDGEKILVGARDGSISEFTSNGRRMLMQSHCDGEVWGLAMVPSQPHLLVTTGDDNKLMVWDSMERKCIRHTILDPKAGIERKAGYGASTMATTTPNQQARAVCVNGTTGHIAIGHNDGRVLVLDSIESLQPFIEKRDPKEWIESMAYSPNGYKLAVGSHDNFIYLYSVPQYSLTHRLRGHSSFIMALDWSEDSNALHTNCGAYELLFWDANTGKQVKNGASSFRDETWHTWTCKLGWPVQGIYEGVIDMTHVNTVDRSASSKYFSVGNDFGEVALFYNPNAEGSKAIKFKAHSEHVTNVKWSQSDTYVFSTGGYDQTIMQWKVV